MFSFQQMTKDKEIKLAGENPSYGKLAALYSALGKILLGSLVLQLNVGRCIGKVMAESVS